MKKVIKKIIPIFKIMGFTPPQSALAVCHLLVGGQAFSSNHQGMPACSWTGLATTYLPRWEEQLDLFLLQFLLLLMSPHGMPLALVGGHII